MGSGNGNSNRFHLTNPIRVEQMFPGFRTRHNYEMQIRTLCLDDHDHVEHESGAETFGNFDCN